jgi:hypothetical protein
MDTNKIIKQLESVVSEITNNLSNNRDAIDGVLSSSTIQEPKKEVIGQIKKIKEVTVVDIYESLESTYKDLGVMLNKFNTSLKKSKDANKVNTCIVNFLEDFYKMREVLLKRALSYEDITFSYAQELQIEKKYLLNCLVKSNDAKEVIKCMTNKP